MTGDNIVETGGETVIVTLLSTNTAVTVGTPAAATVTIADDDASEASITATDGAEPSTNGLFTVVLTNPVSIPNYRYLFCWRDSNKRNRLYSYRNHSVNPG